MLIEVVAEGGGHAYRWTAGRYRNGAGETLLQRLRLPSSPDECLPGGHDNTPKEHRPWTSSVADNAKRFRPVTIPAARATPRYLGCECDARRYAVFPRRPRGSSQYSRRHCAP